MFFSRKTLDLVVEARDRAFEAAVKVLGEARDLIVAAKQAEIDSLRDRVSRLEDDVRYERARADALVDRLLVRDAKVAAVAPAAIAAAAEMDVENAKKRDVIQQAFDQLTETAGDIPAPTELRAHEFAGGGRAVVRSV